MNLHDANAQAFIDEITLSDEAGNFWDAVDSPRTVNPCPTPDCERCEQEWPAQRSRGCMALNGSLRRCAKWCRDDAPFCNYHLERVEEWFAARRRDSIRRSIDFGLSARSDDRRNASEIVSQARNVLFNYGASCVYFYELRGFGVVKIGTSVNVATRIASFANGKGCTFPPGVDFSTGVLIGTTPGGPALEKHLHRIYRHLRVVGEWFELTDELAGDIATLVATKDAAA